MERTTKDIFKHIEDLTFENERLEQENRKLRAENCGLRTENARLHERITVLETSMEDRIKKAVDEAVAKAVEPLRQTIAEKDKEILRLKSQLEKDSSNSSKPPSSNGFKKVPNNRERSGKKQGGQQGHMGTRLNIPKNLEELVADGLAEHVIISDVQSGEPYVSDWTIDLKTTVTFTEHRRKPGLPPIIGYGRQLKTLAVYLCVVGLIAYKRLGQFFHEISHHILTVSKAALEEFQHSAANAVCLEEYIQDLLNGKVLHTDETPVKTSERPNENGVLRTADKTTFNAYIRTYSNKTTTVLTANAYKNEESVVSDNILTQFHGIISQDHEAKFYNYGDAHATCGEHLTRDLKGLSELNMIAWAEDVRRFFIGMNEFKNEEVREGKTACEPVSLCSFESRYDDLLRDGKLALANATAKSFGFDELRRMVNRLEKYKDSYMLFIRNYEAPFTNNQAERDLRHCKTRQKVSGCFRSWQGVLDYCKLRSLLATATKRGENLFDTLSVLWKNILPAGQ